MSKRIFSLILSVFIVTIITISSTGAWVWLTAQVWDILNTVKWNEMITVLNTKINPSNIIAGTGIDVSVNGSNVTVSKSNTSGNITSQNLTIADGVCTTASLIPYNTYINAFVTDTIVVPSVPGSEVNPTWTIDADNTSTVDANVINNNYTDLFYNNSSQNSANKSLPGVNLGSSTPLASVRLHWWTPATYGTTNGKIQWSNNGTTWTDLVTGITKNTGATGDTTDHSISGSWQYIRFFNVTGQNVSWVVLAEIEVFSVGTPWSSSTEEVLITDYNIQLRNNGWLLELCNNDGAARVIEVNSIQ